MSLKKSRREFIAKSLFATAATSVLIGKTNTLFANRPNTRPIVISTWDHGLAANVGAWGVLSKGGRSLDAVEQGVRITESDPNVTTVGIGSAPDREGHVTLDACIMNEHGDCGSVAAIEHIVNPISVARMVMEKTPHVMLVGEGALQFALANGFKKEKLLTEKAEQAWKEWLKTSKYKPIINIENHDTIGMLAMDKQGNISGACTTSGLSYKMRGRVGDSPIIGAGLYVDNEVGGACATGLGETVIRQCGSFLVVELMRQGMDPTSACKEAVRRIIKHEKNIQDLQVGFLAINKQGEIGSYAIHADFNFALHDQTDNKLVDSDFALK
ncbi:MAG: isoaspartyl peptidase/L-asparaginase family protein [Bacteroidota bacterium]|jgi:N4-(beta-N-acetylglucosaminyl)-L-asparaginase